MEWTDDKMAELRQLWCGTKLSAAEIGRRMGITKNMVVGKARRMDLPGRISPIDGLARCEQAARARREKLARAVQLKEEGCTGAQIGRAVGMSAWQAGKLLRDAGHQLSGLRRRALVPGAALPPMEVTARPQARLGGKRQPMARLDGGCRWPIGEPRKPGFRFCGAVDVVRGQSYCAEHCAKAHARPLVHGQALAPRGWVA